MSSKTLPFEITALILSYALRGRSLDNCTFVVFWQANVVSPLESEEFNTFSMALDVYTQRCRNDGCAVIYQRCGDRFTWLQPYLNSKFPHFIDNIHSFLGI